MGLRVRILPAARMCFLVSVVCCLVEVSSTGQYLLGRSPTVCVCVCVCVSLSVIRYNSTHLHLQWVGRRGDTKEDIKKERKRERKVLGGIKIGAGLIERSSEECMLRLVLYVRHFIYWGQCELQIDSSLFLFIFSIRTGPNVYSPNFSWVYATSISRHICFHW